MKLIVAVVQNRDADTTVDALISGDFHVTRLASTGGFLREGNTTLLMGLEDAQVEGAIQVLKRYCHRRRHYTPMPLVGAESGFDLHGHIEVEVGGATVFVLDIEHFEQV